MDIRHSMAVVALALAAVPACGDGTVDDAATASVDTGSPDLIPVMVDYSPTVSDVTALLYLTQHPGIELVSVTLAGTGESHCEAGVPNTLGLLALVESPDVPVACGPEDPVGPGHEWPSDWRVRADALPGISLTPAEATTAADAADLLASVAAASPEPVTIVALGPLTNLAVALERHPAFADDIAMVYTMGGTLDAEGNAPGGLAEWNYYIDPTAVATVLDSGIPVTIIPLDATNHVPVTRSWFESLSAHHTTATADAVLDLHTATRPFELGFFFWDELAAAAAIDESLVSLEERTISIDSTGKSAGRIHADPAGSVVRVAVDVDRARFEAELLTTLNAGVAPSPADPAIAEEAADAATVAYFEAVGEATEVLSAGVAQLFSGPEAAAAEELLDDEISAELSLDDEETVRAFLSVFWSGAMDLMQRHHDALVSVSVPDDLALRHGSLMTAVDALTATRAGRLAAIEELTGDGLLEFLWTPTPEIDGFDAACADLQAAADAAGVAVGVCPD